MAPPNEAIKPPNIVVFLHPYRLVNALEIGPARSFNAESNAPINATCPLLQPKSASIDSKKTPKHELSNAANI